MIYHQQDVLDLNTRVVQSPQASWFKRALSIYVEFVKRTKVCRTMHAINKSRQFSGVAGFLLYYRASALDLIAPSLMTRQTNWPFRRAVHEVRESKSEYHRCDKGDMISVYLVRV